MRLIKIGLLTTGLLLATCSVVVTANAVHVPGKVLPQAEAANAVAERTGAAWVDVKVNARDGAVLDGWLFTPAAPNGSAVIALHGVADNRMGMLSHAEFLLRNGFTVLVPDSRGHGRSGGALVTYGVREAGDVPCWADRLFRDRAVHRLYGIGQSMGAAILLESLRAEPRFRAVVADSAFANFREIAYERLEQVSGIPQAAFWPIVNLGFLYANVRYDVNLGQASPVEAIRGTRVPVLLIHGAADTNIPPHHSVELHAANGNATRLWLVPGAEHVSSFATDPAVYERAVVAWLQEHR